MKNEQEILDRINELQKQLRYYEKWYSQLNDPAMEREGLYRIKEIESLKWVLEVE